MTPFEQGYRSMMKKLGMYSEKETPALPTTSSRGQVVEAPKKRNKGLPHPVGDAKVTPSLQYND